MNILCFASTTTMLEKVSKSFISLNPPGISIELYKNFETLRARLCQPRKPDCIAVVCLKNKKEIQQVTDMQEIFNGTKLILVLPKRDQESIKAAYKIFPRFLAFADDNFSDIASIVEKMTGCAADQTKHGYRKEMTH